MRIGFLELTKHFLSAIIAFAVVGALNCSASGQTTDLACGGTLHQYQPERSEASIAPAATSVDLTKRLIQTPLGKFSISEIQETKIWFVDPGKALWMSAYLDRLTGEMTIFWFHSKDMSHPTAYAELSCSPAKRLF
jgi:hypothetical protein